MTTFSESTLQSVERKNVIYKEKTELIAEINNLLDEIEKKQVSIGLKSDKSKSKNLGQYFTNLEISKILSHQISGDFKKSTISIIDAGAGIGILGISSIKRLIEVTDMKDFHISSVELDTNLIPMLTESFRKLNLILIKYGYSLSSSIFNIDFVTGRNHFTNKQFDIAILNPPYFKINSESIYFNRTNDLFKGNPNIYTQFIAVCLSQLNKDGQLIVISPRSFTNGLYFKGFREFLFSRYAISHIHSFISRDSLFDKVLQEVVIYKIISRKNYNGSTEIVISTSEKENEVKLLFFLKYSRF